MKADPRPFLAGLAVVPLLLALGVDPSTAGTGDGRPKILVHVQPSVTKNTCTAGSLTDCSQAVTKGTLTPPGGPGYYFLYLLAARGAMAGVTGLQCGIWYQNGAAGDADDQTGIDVFSWTLCATLEFVTPGNNAWPKPGAET